ncbi:hypothetical protein ABFS82_06G044800 [Erythranthe guttata]|uniref:Leucine-rich repeat-containing N-terminal plant-type domain-containing protein n=1 Tax=Erythranthe guttata TaxID=4155 RepID=A0A022QCL8_ERYGU|nr:PREDICTED: probably inactive leucine-rich repeat receptor-like protein kinase At2g25790 [Erythranthe guttata]EYU24978.1 hypothetical protein MIMGU_mgv1a025899mg [Erythranthe guttata]|eukprot:XP_012852002.1 PREDICTED: probably inactive leucine-rich repeat receptor-like protein kinase At2g25790 [Erythranthe guttata]
MLSSSNLSLTLFLLFNLFILHQSLAATEKQCHVDDESGLLAFKSGIISDQSGSLNSWKPGTDCCKWAGIKCKPEFNNRVTVIDLYGWPSDGTNILAGPISPALAKLQSLESLKFDHLGNLTGPFPDFLLSMPNITTIILSDNKLSGTIPRNIVNLLKLETLALDGNQFSGTIPSLGKSTSLLYLNLGNNRLSGGIPISFRRLRKLSWLELSSNQLTGSIPDIFSGLTSIVILYLSHNKFSGNIPKSLSYLKPINVDLSHNALIGQIPDISSNSFNAINGLNLSWNQLSGVIPENFAKFTQITLLDFSHNKLNGSLPEMRMARSMHALDFSYNDYRFGKIPKWIGNTSTNILGLAKCGIKMKLNDWKPTVIYGNVYLSENELTGNPLQFLISQNTYLMGFWALGNKLKFDMKHLKLGKKMVNLDLSNNLVYGNVPKTVSRLQELNVSHNHLCGQLPATKFPATAFLGNDCLCGAPLPPCKS